MQNLLKKPSNTPSDLFEINAKPILRKPNTSDDLFEACGKKGANTVQKCSTCGSTLSSNSSGSLVCYNKDCGKESSSSSNGVLGAETSYDAVMPVYF